MPKIITLLLVDEVIKSDQSGTCISEYNDMQGNKGVSDSNILLDDVNPVLSVDCQGERINELRAFCTAEIAAMRPSAARAYSQAVSSFFNSVQANDIYKIGINEIEQWVAEMAVEGLSLGTAVFYMKNLRALCNKAAAAGLLDLDPDAFDTFLRDSVCVDGNKLPMVKIDTLRALYQRPGRDSQACDMLICSLFCGGMPVADLLALQIADTDCIPEACTPILNRYSSLRSKYVFPTGTSRRASQSTIRSFERRIGYALSMAGEYTPVMARMLWASIALAVGVAPTVVRWAIRDISVDSPLMLLPVREIDRSVLAEACSQVADAVAYAPMRWHAMHLRPHVSPDDIVSRLGNAMPQTFYPMVHKKQRVGHRLVESPEPLLPYVLFFRTSDCSISPLMRRIGDLAWCYRQTAASSSSYAIISDAEMYAFQIIAGQFTDDMRINETGSDLGPGQRVRIIGGILAGYEGTIYKSVASDCDADTRLFMLNIGTQTLTWQATIPATQLQSLD